MGIGEDPDNVSAATVSVTCAAGRPLRAAKTTPLMTIEEEIEAIPTCAGRSDFGPAICLGDLFRTQRPRDLRSSQGQATDMPPTANALRSRNVAVSGDKRAMRRVLTRLRTTVAFIVTLGLVWIPVCPFDRAGIDAHDVVPGRVRAKAGVRPQSRDPALVTTHQV